MSSPGPVRRAPSGEEPAQTDVARFRGEVFSRRAFEGPVEEWKRQVLAHMGSGGAIGERNPLIRLHVTFGFFAVAIMVGSIRGPMGAVGMLALLSSVVLAQELSRAIFALAQGRASSVRISALGGDTELRGPPLKGVRAAAFIGVGSAANLLVAADALWLAERVSTPMVAGAARTLACAHAAWGIANLLPVVPFRAGTAISAHLSPSRRFAHATVSGMFVVTSGAIALSWSHSPVVLGVFVLAALACGSKVREAFSESCDLHAGVDALVAEAEVSLSTDPARASELVREGLVLASSARQQQRLWKMLAWAGIRRRDPFLAHGALLRLLPASIDVHLLGSYLSSCNRVDDAVEFLEEARRREHRSPETTKLLADLRFGRGEHEAVLSLLRADAALLSPEDRKAIETAVLGGTTDEQGSCSDAAAGADVTASRPTF